MWYEGFYKELFYQAKIYDSHSKNGMYGGPIVKLYVKDNNGNILVNYDREFEVEPSEQIISWLVNFNEDVLNSL